VCTDDEVDLEGLQQDQNSQQNDYEENMFLLAQCFIAHAPENGSCNGMSRQNYWND